MAICEIHGNILPGCSDCRNKVYEENQKLREMLAVCESVMEKVTSCCEVCTVCASCEMKEVLAKIKEMRGDDS